MCESPGQEQESTAASETSQAQRSVRELATAGGDIQRVMLDLARAQPPETARAGENSDSFFSSLKLEGKTYKPDQETSEPAEHAEPS